MPTEDEPTAGHASGYKLGSRSRVHAAVAGVHGNRFGGFQELTGLRCCHSLAAAQFSFYLELFRLSSSASMLLRPVILRFDSLPSTNTEAARQAASGAAEGLCVVAREQTSGRGRQQRIWVSPPDAGLYFSIVLRPRLDMNHWPLLTLMSALAVSDALADACALSVDIKWPNDIEAGGRKVCGILAEAIETSVGRACIVGIGLNLKESALPSELRETATAVETLTGFVPDIEQLLQSLTRAISRRYQTLQEPGGAEQTIKEWVVRSSYAHDKRVRVTLDAESIEGITRGLEPDGALRVETEAGEMKIIRAGDVLALRPAHNSFD
ncbi:MAG TPA: biotin--[acetyl-CoA-carboxylase] ligase [Pyrinomonadaceae bacterium]